MLIAACALIGVAESRFGVFGKNVNSQWTPNNCTVQKSQVDKGNKNSYRAVFFVSLLSKIIYDFSRLNTPKIT